MELTEKILNRIKELEQLRDKEIIDNPENSGNIRRKYNTRIGCLKKHGVENVFQLNSIKNKIKQSNIEKYGAEHPMKTEQGKEIHKQAMLRDYGVEYALQKEEFKEKSKQTQYKNHDGKYAWNTDKQRKTCLEKYGYVCALQNPEIYKKTRQSNMKNHNGMLHFQTEEFKEYLTNKAMKEHNVPYYCMTKKCKEAQGTIISKINLRFSELLTKNNIEHELEFNVGRNSYDIHVLNSNLLIEINPTYTHNSTIGPHFNNSQKRPKPNDYHFNKWKLAKDNGYDLISIFDWMDWNKVLDLIKAKLKMLSNRIFANKCIVKEIKQSEANKFLDLYHVQGRASGQTVCVGLFYKDELVQVQTFGKARFNTKVEWEAIRLASKFDTYIIGGVSKGFAYFVRNYDPSSIISYNSLNISTGYTDDLQGFKFQGYSGSQGMWINVLDNDNPFMVRAGTLRSLGIDKVLHKPKEYYPDYDGTFENSNEGLIIKEGYVEVFDCGNVIYKWEK